MPPLAGVGRSPVHSLYHSFNSLLGATGQLGRSNVNMVHLRLFVWVLVCIAGVEDVEGVSLGSSTKRVSGNRTMEFEMPTDLLSLHSQLFKRQGCSSGFDLCGM